MSADLVLRNSDLAIPESITHPVLAFLVSLPSANSRRSALKILDNVARHWAHDWRSMPWHTLDKADIDLLKASELARISERTGKRLSCAHINKTLWPVKGVMGACFDLGLIDGNRLMRVQRIKGVGSDWDKEEDEKPGRYITQRERERVLKACQDGTAAGVRDEAVLILMCACGLRRSEVSALKLESILANQEDMISLQIWGKGRKKRVLYLDNGGHDALLNWLDIRGSASGPMFWQGRRGGHLVKGKGIGQHSIYGILKKRAGQAGIADILTLDLRRSWISDLLALGIDIATVAKLAGHASVTTTAAYDRRGTEAKIAACKAIHFACSPRR